MIKLNQGYIHQKMICFLIWINYLKCNFLNRGYILQPQKGQTLESYRNKGYAKTLLKSLYGNYKQKYDRMLIGTTENNIPFFVKQGFDKYEKTIKNFFIDNYDEEIKYGDLICTDLIYYSKELKKKSRDDQ